MNRDDVRHYIDVAITGVGALNTIGDIAGTSLVKPGTVANLQTALVAIQAIVTTVTKGLQGTITTEQVARELAELEQKLRDNDQAADASLDAKFPK